LRLTINGLLKAYYQKGTSIKAEDRWEFDKRKDENPLRRRVLEYKGAHQETFPLETIEANEASHAGNISYVLSMAKQLGLDKLIKDEEFKKCRILAYGTLFHFLSLLGCSWGSHW
jgi:hypothetical protein